MHSNGAGSGTSSTTVPSNSSQVPTNRFETVKSLSNGTNGNTIGKGKRKGISGSLGTLFHAVGSHQKEGSAGPGAGHDGGAAQDEREDELMAAVHAASDETTKWTISVEQAKTEGLFLSSAASTGAYQSASHSSKGSKTGRGILSKAGRKSRQSPSITSLSKSRKSAGAQLIDEIGHAGADKENGSAGTSPTLLVLYITTGTSSLTLYRDLGQLAQLVHTVRDLHQM